MIRGTILLTLLKLNLPVDYMYLDTYLAYLLEKLKNTPDQTHLAPFWGHADPSLICLWNTMHGCYYS